MKNQFGWDSPDFIQSAQQEHRRWLTAELAGYILGVVEKPSRSMVSLTDISWDEFATDVPVNIEKVDTSSLSDPGLQAAADIAYQAWSRVNTAREAMDPCMGMEVAWALNYSGMDDELYVKDIAAQLAPFNVKHLSVFGIFEGTKKEVRECVRDGREPELLLPFVTAMEAARDSYTGTGLFSAPHPAWLSVPDSIV